MPQPPCSLVLFSLLVACGGGPASSDAGDSGVGDTGPLGPMVAPPDIPWLDMGAPAIAEPLLTPCPAGWSTVARADREDGPVACHPYGGEPDVCPEGSAHFAGDGACSPVGAPCPMGDFPEGLPTDVEVLYVLSSAPAGGDGTEALPLMTITDAMNIASRGTVIAIGKGTYDEAVRVGPGITLWGACARDTRVTASSPGSFAQAVITVPSADVHLKNLRLGPANLPGLSVFGTRASASIDGLLVEGAQALGLYVVHGAQMDARELSVSGTRSDTSGDFARGLTVESGATAAVTRALFSGNRDVGVLVDGEGTSVTLSDVVVTDTLAQENDGTGGRGLSVQFGATAEVTRALFSGNRDIGVFVGGEGASLTLTDAVVEDTQGKASDGTAGRGVSVQDGATAEVIRALVSRNRHVGVFVGAHGTWATLSDVVVEETQGQASDGTLGRGLGIEAGATARVTRALFSRNRELGVLASGGGTSLTLSDVVVEDTQEQASDGTGGRGLGVQDGAAAELTRALVARNRDVGVYVASGATAVTLSDVVVEDTREASDGTGGQGIGVGIGATAEVSRALFSRNRQVGVFVTGAGTSVTLSDVVVEDTQEQASDGTHGRGLSVQLGASAEVSRALFSGSREFGVFALDPGTLVRLSDVVVMQTDEQACASTTCADRPFGVALAGVSEASLVATRFEALDSALCGVLVQDDAQIDLSLGLVAGSPIGVCLQVDDYAIARLTESVRYLNNETNLDATNLPVPEPVSLFDSTE